MGKAAWVVKSWPRTPLLVVKTAFNTRTVDEMIQDKAKSGAEMKRSLGWFQLMCMGIGAIIGSGIYVLTGQVANQTAGPAVCLSFVVGGICATLSALIYSEWSTELPVAGSSFTYVMASLGQLPAFLVTSNMIMEYVLSIAAIARAWSSYLATLCSKDSSFFRFPAGAVSLDPMAVAIIIIMTVLICLSTKESSRVNLVLTCTKLVGVLFVIIAGFTKASPPNLTTDFGVYGVRGVMNGAAIIFFAYLGYDAVATLAEEAKNPSRDMPIGIIGATTVCTVLYIIMCIVICMMVPYDQIDPNAPFSTAFSQVGLNWARYVVAFMALVGISTALLVNMLGQARIFTMAAREHLIPLFWAKVSQRYGTPLAAQVTMGAASAFIGFFTDLPILANMVSIGTLYAFLNVAAGLIFYRLYDPKVSTRADFIKVLAHLLAICGASVGLAIYYNVSNDWYGIVAFIIVWFLATASCHIFCKHARVPRVYGVPLFPWVPSGSVILNCFLLSTLDRDSYIRFGIWSAMCLTLYCLFSVHSIAYHHNHDQIPYYKSSTDTAAARKDVPPVNGAPTTASATSADHMPPTKV
ncbi:g3200 [Coccomyxa viridis]|uniref:G3200 protein n=1 Tax=Coccomyxa viridis TaxID=1274662 RepID=A0ABP1FM90_9CHLO